MVQHFLMLYTTYCLPSLLPARVIVALCCTASYSGGEVILPSLVECFPLLPTCPGGRRFSVPACMPGREVGGAHCATFSTWLLLWAPWTMLQSCPPPRQEEHCLRTPPCSQTVWRCGGVMPPEASHIWRTLPTARSITMPALLRHLPPPHL